MNKISLGTAQFGFNYGLTNISGQVDNKEIKNIIEFARKCGINSLDTAAGYGDSEKNLGEFDLNGWQIISKLPELNLKSSDLNGEVLNFVNKTLKNLNVTSIYGLLLHKPIQLLENNGVEVWDYLLNLKDKGYVSKIGFSIYNPKEIEDLWCNGFKPDIVQAPFNIFDQRIKDSGWLSFIKNNDIEVHTRSVFLQGLLLMNLNNRPDYFKKWNDIFNLWEEWLKDNNISGLEAALNFVLNEKMIDKIIVGIDNSLQLKEVVSSKLNYTFDVPEIFNISDEELINPTFWKL